MFDGIFVTNTWNRFSEMHFKQLSLWDNNEAMNSNWFAWVTNSKNIFTLEQQYKKTPWKWTVSKLKVNSP